ncbi:hypothetical protein ABEO98_25480, partial [Brevibacillus parabrevis]|uniref:hypothetical protein n=1 Tax=Brevibacillus parabrevis TaxID=54914 RepID=UPI003D1EB8F3
VRPEPGSNSPIKFVAGSKLANHLMIDSSTLSLFSFQRTFVSLAAQRRLSHLTTSPIVMQEVFFTISLHSVATRSNITN